jgi:hypothetical protein
LTGEPHEGIAGLHHRHERFLVGGAARMRLHVGETALEQLLGALDGQRLGLVDELAAAVVAVAGIALRVLVGEHAAGRLQHRARNHVLGRDQLDLVLLAFQLAVDHAGEIGIALSKRCREEARMRRRLAPCGSGHRIPASVDTPERRAALISWGLPRQQGRLLHKVNERTGKRAEGRRGLQTGTMFATAPSQAGWGMLGCASSADIEAA